MFPPFPPQDDLAAQLIHLISDILSLQKPPSLVALFVTLLTLEQKFGVIRRFINIVGKAKTQRPPLPEAPKTNGNGHTNGGNGNGSAKEPIILALISSEKQYILSLFENDRIKNREDKLEIRENLERMSLRITHVERDVGDIQRAFRDELAPLRTKLEGIAKYIEDQKAA